MNWMSHRCSSANRLCSFARKIFNREALAGAYLVTVFVANCAWADHHAGNLAWNRPITTLKIFKLPLLQAPSCKQAEI